MQENFKRYTDFLVAEGTEKVPHSKTPFLAHLISVYRDLQSWGCPEKICVAGMFHSIYGTEMFRRFGLSLDRRDEVRALIGERAEHLAYLYCAMNRESFDAHLDQTEGGSMVDRFTGETIPLSEGDYDDLCTLMVCDWLEQVARTGGNAWTYRREEFHRMAQRLGGIALESFDRVYAEAPAAAAA